jgi:hypothetical protein
MSKGPIKHEHFLTGILEDMTATFGGRAYSETQIEILSRLVDRYGRENVRKVAMRLIENGTRKPFPIDFKNALQNLSSHHKPAELQGGGEYQIQCKHCMDTGYVFLKAEFVEHRGHPVVALCKCLIARQMSETAEKLPRIDLMAWGFVDAFPAHLFNPARRSGALKTKSGSDQKHNFENTVKWWNFIKNNARHYWAEEKRKKGASK